MRLPAVNGKSMKEAFEEESKRENYHVYSDVVNTRADDFYRRCAPDKFHDISIISASRDDIGDVGNQLRDIRDAENF